MFLTIIVFILILGLLVFVHELGHFIVAKKAGVRVEEFGFGLPPRLFGVKRGETIYSLNLLPIGGFVKIFGESGEGENSPDSFASKSIFTRGKILVSGVVMNFVLAVALLSLGFWLGLPTAIEDENQSANFKNEQIQIIQIAQNSPAEKAGIKLGDTIKELRFNGAKLTVIKISEIQDFINNHKEEEIQLIIQRGDEELIKNITPRLNPPDNEGALGIAMAKTAIVSYPWHRAIYMGFVSTYNLIILIVVTLAGLIRDLIFTGKITMDLTGPVGIYSLTGQMAQLGFVYVLQFAALLSVNLGIINILPFPALDGGRLLFLLIEKIKGSPISRRLERIIHTAGFALLIILMLAITWRDVARMF